MPQTTVPSEIPDWSLTETVSAVVSRKVSALEVAEATLERIETRQKTLNCFIRIDAEGARAGARAADAALAAGHTPGKLHGAPLAHKDMYYRRGTVVTCGSAIRRNFVPDFTATVLERLDAQGAVHMGALNMSEFASGPTGHNVHWGNCRNPWNPEHITGGSSTGSGSAVGGRMVSGSLGSDTGGSIRLPAGICGVYGIKPTQGRISRHGVMGLSYSLDNVGPLGRTAADCARLLGVVAGHDPEDETSSHAPVQDYEAGLALGVKGLTIAIARPYYWDGMSTEIGDHLEDVLKTFRTLGADVKEVDLPHHDIISGLAGIVAGAEQCALHEHWVKTEAEKYAPLVKARMLTGFGFTAVDYVKAMSLRAGLVKDVVKAAFGAADALFLPVLRFPVPTLAETDVRDGETLHEVLGRINYCTRPLNYLGLPGLSVPCGFSKNGLPIGFQLVGRPFDEAMLFRVAAAYERETNWPARLPPLS